MTPGEVTRLADQLRQFQNDHAVEFRTTQHDILLSALAIIEYFNQEQIMRR